MMLSSKFLSIVSLLGFFTVPTVAVTVRINELGDSITGSPGCWRALLWQKLQAAGITNTDFVGTLSGQGCGFAYDGENDGHGGFQATGIANANQLPGWLAVSQPDIVTMMLGTNDVWSSLSTTVILQAYTTLVGQMRAQNPKMVIMVAQITPMHPTGCANCAPGVVALNAAIPAWAASISTSQSPVSVVDLWTGFDDSIDTADGVHPNDAGAVKIANAWFGPMSAAIKSFGGSTTPVPTTLKSTTTSKPTTITTKPTTTTTKPTTIITTTNPATTGLPIYSQCGGLTWNGGTVCAAGLTCHFYGDYYSQCLPPQ